MSSRPSPDEVGELALSYLSYQIPTFNPFSGKEWEGEGVGVHIGARAGFDVPRYCAVCGRRLIVQVRPDGWHASCSRHGGLDSDWLYVEGHQAS